jgi:hypothetical protein
MVQLTVKGAVGEMGLLTQHDSENGRLCRSLHLRASEDGKSVLLIDIDERKVGIQREYRFEITTGDLIALIRAHGAELPGENHVCSAEAG